MNRILVDTSVWIDYFNNYDSPYSAALDELLNTGLVVICNLIKAEVLPFLPDRKTFEEIKNYLDALPLLEEYESMWEDIIEYQYSLVHAGVQGTGIPDLMICALSLKHGEAILTKDLPFQRISKVVPIELLEVTTL